MTPRAPALALIAVMGILPSACAGRPRQAPAETPPAARIEAEQMRSARRLAALERQHARWPEDRQMVLEGAKSAWAFIDRSYQHETGFVKPLDAYPYATLWDVGSMLGALYSAHGLGLLPDAEYERRADRILTTLGQLPLTRHGVFNKAYDTRTGTMARVGHGASDDAGWSALDLGRLLVWLKIVGTTPALAQKAAAVVSRNDFSVALHDGYLRGEGRDAQGREERYQEGELGYEQYAARGFALWGYRAEKALRLRENALPIAVMDQPLVADYRRWDRLTNEPFLLWGLELGWDPPTELLARRMLRAQQARYEKTGVITITGEDAMSEPPHYFYYYCIFASGMDFAVDVQDRKAVVDGPRWTSAKSTFGFHALMPTAYTSAAMRALAPARARDEWASGVYEGSGTSTGNASVNTAAVILEASLVDLNGGPLLREGRD